VVRRNPSPGQGRANPRGNHTRRSGRARDEELASVAKTKAAMPGLGDPLWHPGERVERASTMDVKIYGEDEQLTLLWTTSLNVLGARKNGRLIVALGPSATYIFGAAFWIEERGRRCVQSIWIEPEYRRAARHVRTGEGSGIDLGYLLAAMAREAGIDCALRPVSTAGKSWATRQGLRLR
jgi:hypothetical protein